MHTKQTAEQTEKWEPLSRDQRGGQRFREHRGNEGLLVCGMHITGIERETHKTGTKRDSEDIDK